MAQAPRTRYAKCGDLDIAYQVLGDGTVDLVALPGAFVAFDTIDGEPALYRFHRRLASIARVIRFGHRGMGASSRPRSNSTIGPDEWADDAIAVMDAAGSEQATIFCSGWSAMTALTLADRYPERVRSLAIVNGSARLLRAPDYPIGADAGADDAWRTVALDPEAVEQGFDVLRSIAPSVVDDATFRRRWDLAGNRSHSPSEARATVEALAAADVRHTLERITVPTLVLHRWDAVMIPVEHGRYIAEHIAGSRYVELPGTDTLHWTGDAAAILDEVEEFVRIVRHQLQRFAGREVNTAGDGFVATFTSPSVAIDCAEAIAAAVRPLGIEVRAGIHAGEVELRGADIAGMATISARASLRSRDPARCSSRRRCARSSPARADRSSIAASTTSRACPVGGGYTPRPQADSPTRS